MQLFMQRVGTYITYKIQKAFSPPFLEGLLIQSKIALTVNCDRSRFNIRTAHMGTGGRGRTGGGLKKTTADELREP